MLYCYLSGESAIVYTNVNTLFMSGVYLVNNVRAVCQRVDGNLLPVDLWRLSWEEDRAARGGIRCLILILSDQKMYSMHEATVAPEAGNFGRSQAHQLHYTLHNELRHRMHSTRTWPSAPNTFLPICYQRYFVMLNESRFITIITFIYQPRAVTLHHSLLFIINDNYSNCILLPLLHSWSMATDCSCQWYQEHLFYTLIKTGETYDFQTIFRLKK